MAENFRSRRKAIPCGVVFDAKKHLKEHPDQAWQAPLLEDEKANAWTVVTATKQCKNATEWRLRLTTDSENTLTNWANYPPHNRPTL